MCPDEKSETTGHFSGHVTMVRFPLSFRGVKKLPHIDILAGNYLPKWILPGQYPEATGSEGFGSFPSCFGCSSTRAVLFCFLSFAFTILLLTVWA